jgi:hypothetical protein
MDLITLFVRFLPRLYVFENNGQNGRRQTQVVGNALEETPLRGMGVAPPVLFQT